MTSKYELSTSEIDVRARQDEAVIEYVDFGDWKFRKGLPLRVSRDEGVLPSQDLLDRFVAVHSTRPEYDYWMHATMGVPSPVVRIDFSPSQPDYPYEIEVRPAGLGIYTGPFGEAGRLRAYFSGLQEHLGRPIGVKVLPSIRGGDCKRDRSLDSRVFAKNAGLEFFEDDQVLNPNYLLWARGGVEDEETVDKDTLEQIEAQSLTPVRDHGNKSYLPRMGLATNITSIEDIDFDEAFCLKPMFGSKSEGVGIYVPGKKVPGTSTKSQIHRFLESNTSRGGSLRQDYVPPQEVIITNDHRQQYMIFRIFATWMPEDERYELIGGCYLIRPNVKIHGASDSIVGKVKIV